MRVFSVEESGQAAARGATDASRAARTSECSRSHLWAVASISIVLTLAYTAPFGSLNHATYLLDPLQRAFPELFTRDWFVAETPTYMPVFGWLAQWLFVLDHDGATAFVLVHIIVSLASYAAIYSIVCALHGSWRTFAVAAAFVTLTKGVSMGGSYLLAGYLQPSSLATLGWLIAIAAFIRDRYLTCGIAAAAAGVIHANFLVLGVGLFVLTACARRDLALRDYARLLVPQLVVLACFVPQLAEAAGPSERALTILSELHSPMHYSPARQLWWIGGVVCWQVAGCSAMFVLGDVKPARVLWRLSLVASVLTCGTALLVQLPPLQFLVQLFVPRLAPFAQLACIALVAAALVRHASTPRQRRRLERTTLILGPIVAVLIYSSYVRTMLPWPAIAIASGLIVVIFIAPARIARAFIAVLASLALAFALWTTPPGRSITTRPSGSLAELELETWARTRTETDALFLIPPNLGRFRLLSRRAVVIDTKSPPLRPDLLEQWYERLRAGVGGAPWGRTPRELEAAYGQLTTGELERIARAFGAEYFVVTGAVAADEALRDASAFRNSEYAVYRVTP